MASPGQLKLRWWSFVGAEAPVSGRLLAGAAFVALIAISAQLAVPLPGTPVPVTLQDLAVLVTGVVLGPVQGALTVASYVLLGALGAPVFSNGNGGIAWLMGPTGGYLLAFPLSAFVIGLATAPGRAWWWLPIGLVAAQAVYFGGGVVQLALVSGSDLGRAVSLGVIPFLPGAAVKSVLLIVFAAALRSWGRGRGARRPD